MKSHLRIAANALVATLEAPAARLFDTSVKRSLILTLGLVLVSSTLATAATDTWSGATNTDWSSATNWNSGSGPVPGSGDTAVFNTNVAQINNTVANQSVNTIDFGPGIPTTGMTIGSTGGKQLILSNGGSIQTLSTLVTTGTININAPLVLSPNSSTSSGSYTFANYTGNTATDAVFNFGGTISAATTTGSEVLNLASTNNKAAINTISGVISDGGAAGGVSLVQNGTTTWSLTAADTISGSVTVNAGIMQLTGSGSLNNISSVNVIGNGVTYGASGGALNGNLGGTGIFVLNDTSTSINRLSSTTPINLNSGTFAIQGSTGTLTQSLGAVTLAAGHSSFENFNGSGGSLVTTLASVTQNNNAALTIFGNSATALGSATNEILVTSDSNLLSGLIGGGGAAGSQTVSILPWISYTGSDTSAIQGHQTRANSGFVTYTSAGGFRALSASEYANNLTSGSTTNVELTANTSLTSGSATVNSLFLNGATSSQNLTISPGATLNVTSGAIETPSANGTASFDMGIIGGGTINFGPNTGYFTGNLAGNLIVALAGSGGMVFAPNGAINISTAATYTGATDVAGGTLGQTIANALPVGTSLRIDAGALYIGDYSGGIQQVKSLSGTGIVGMGSTTTVLNVGTGAITGANETVTIGNGGTLTPGDPSGSLQAGTLTFGGGTGFSYTAPVNLSMLSGSTLVIDLASATQNGNLSLLNGSASITGGTLTIAALGSFTPTVNEQWTFLESTAAITNDAFTSITPGYSVSISGDNLVLTYIGVTPANAYFTGASSSDLNTTANYYTTGAGTTVPAGPPGSTTNLYLTANAGGANVLTPTLNTGNLTVASLTFTGSGTAATSGVTLSGTSTLTIGTSAGITDQSGSGADAVSAPVALGATQTWTNGNTKSLTFSGGITGTGSLTIANTSTGNTTLSSGAVNFTGALSNTGSGSGTTTISANIGSNVTTVTENSSTSPLVLSGSNSYTGTTTVTAGALIVNNTSGSATGTNTLSVGPGATLAGTGTAGTTTGAPFTISGSSGSPATVLVGQNAATANSDKTTSHNLTLLAGGTSTLSNVNLVLNVNATAVGGTGIAGNLNSGSADNELVVGGTNLSFGSGVKLTLNLQNEPAIVAANTPYVLIAGTGVTSNTSGVSGGQYTGLTFGAVTPLGTGVTETLITGSNLSLVFGNTVDTSFYGANSYLFLYQNTNTGVDDIEVEVVPEPGTWALMLGGLALLALHIRRRSQRS